LEIGAGPGRFTLQLAELGARIVVTDFSANQLALNRERVTAARMQDAVEGYCELDLRDLRSLGDESFDVALACGGSLSYVFEDAERCFGKLLRVTRAGGVVVASVMSVLGAYRHFLAEVADIDENLGLDVNNRIIRTGDTRPAAEGGHVCRMLRRSELVEMFGRHPCRLCGRPPASGAPWGPWRPLSDLPPTLHGGTGSSTARRRRAPTQASSPPPNRRRPPFATPTTRSPVPEPDGRNRRTGRDTIGQIVDGGRGGDSLDDLDSVQARTLRLVALVRVGNDLVVAACRRHLYSPALSLSTSNSAAMDRSSARA
jgi:hypothetical protein